MKKLKLTEVQVFRLREAHRHTVEVLIGVKRQPLVGQALEDMKSIERAVTELETLVAVYGNK